MIDCCRTKWEDCEPVENPTGKFLQIRIRISKANRGERREQITIAQIDDEDFDIFKRLHQWWEEVGKPDTGFILENPRKPGSYFHPNQLVRVAQKSAREMSWPREIWPKAHSGRNSLVAVLMKMGIKTQLLTVFLRWKDGSPMLSRYQGDQLECSSKGTAFALKRVLEQGEMDNLEQVSWYYQFNWSNTKYEILRGHN